MCVEVRGQPSGVDSHFPLYGSWALSSDGRQVLLSDDPSHPPSLIFFNFLTHNYKLPFRTPLSVSRVSFHLHLTPVTFDFPPDFFIDSFTTKECIV